MAVFKCKMCGAPLEVQSGSSVAECEYCGTQQTLPKLNDEKRANLYDRANHFRRNNEFDKAMGIYENILNEDNTDAEAYWSLVLCRYGIEYVEDPVTRKRVPTVNRTQYTSIFDDNNYKSALEYADSYQRIVYEEEAKAINEIQKGILAISQKEEPFDVFICYKESDNNGKRTHDSVLAQDLYYQLKQEGFKVFFARITLEDKLGSAYEPYIFAALNSAKVMVVLGTRPEYFNAVWVKNEWSRYLALIKQGEKKMLIPAYKDMDPYNLPAEFSHLQSQDMSKLGFMQDLIRGIKKIVKSDLSKETVVKETVVSSSNASVNSYIKRVSIFLEDGDWNSANEYCEKILDIDPQNAQAYLGKLMVEHYANSPEKLAECNNPISNNRNYQKILRFGDEKLISEITGYNKAILDRKENERLEKEYRDTVRFMKLAMSEERFRAVAQMFAALGDYRDAAQFHNECLAAADKLHAEQLARMERALQAEQARLEEKARKEAEEKARKEAEKLRIAEEKARKEAEAKIKREEIRKADSKLRIINILFVLAFFVCIFVFALSFGIFILLAIPPYNDWFVSVLTFVVASILSLLAQAVPVVIVLPVIITGIISPYASRGAKIATLVINTILLVAALISWIPLLITLVGVGVFVFLALPAFALNEILLIVLRTRVRVRKRNKESEAKPEIAQAE